MRLGKPALIHSFSSFVSKISGVIRDIFLAGFLGTGILSDKFFIALKLPVSFRRSLSEETFNSAFIPLYGRSSDQSDTRLKHHFALKVLFLSYFPDLHFKGVKFYKQIISGGLECNLQVF